LLTGLSPHNDIFPEISDYMGRVNIDRDELLSLAAFNRLRDKGCVGTLWVPLVGSDHFNLTGKGWLRALSFFEDGTGKWPRTDEGPEYQYFCDHNLFEWRGAEFVRWP
jgi:hypothetical protein